MADRQIVVRLRAETAAYEAAMVRASAATKGVATSASAAAKTATAANAGLGRSAAATAAGMKAASNSMSGVASAAKGTSGSISTLGSGMVAASAGAGRLGSGMKTAAASTAGVTSAARGTAGSISALGSGMGAAGLAATKASGNIRAVGGAASAAGAGAASASGGLRSMGGAATAAAAGASSATGSLDKVGGSATRAGAGAAAATSGFGRLSGSIRENSSAWGSLSTTAMVAGGAIVGGLGLATKAAISWESAWAGVEKTNDGNAQQMAKLEGELRQLAKTLPASHAEIAAVAEAAGQLGIERENVAGFTKVMIDMGESTNLAAEDAATSIARFSNVMGTAQTDADKIGSAIVELGNNFATTESEIMQMSLRLTGAGRQANMTEGDVLGMATALSSVGIEAQAGGTAFSRVIIEIGKSVDTGNEKLETFAKVAGMSVESFSKLWRENSGEAMQRFIAGLGEMQAKGQSLEPTLAALGMTDIRVGDALRRSASGADQFTAAMKTGNTAYLANTALAKEASVRYETSASKIATAGNRIKDAMIDVGASVAPAMAKAAEGAASVTSAFSKLPPQAQSVVTGIAGITGATLLIGGAAVKAISGVQSLKSSLDAIGVVSRNADGDLTRVGTAVAGMRKWGSYALGAAAVVTILGNIIESGRDAPASIEQIKSSLLDMNEAGRTVSIDKEFNRVGESVKVLGVEVGSSVGGIKGAFDQLNDPSNFQKFDDLNGIIPGVTSKSDRLRDSFERSGQALANMPADKAAAQFDLMTQAIGGGEANAKKLLELMPAYRDKLLESENAARAAGSGADAMAGDLDGMGDSADSAQDSIDTLADEIKGLGSTFLGERGGAREYQAALDDMAASIKENGRTLDITTEKGRANESALDDLATSTQEWAASTVEAGGSVERAQGILDRGKSKWIEYATSMGMSKSEAKALADELFLIPDDVKTDIKTNGADEGKRKTKDFKDQLLDLDKTNAAPGVEVKGAGKGKADVSGLQTSIDSLFGKDVTVKESGAKPSAGRVDGLTGFINRLTGKDVKVTESGAAPSKTRVMGLDDKITLLNGKTVTVKEEGASPSIGRLGQMKTSIAVIDGKTVQVTEIGSTAAGGRVVEFKNKIYEVPANRDSNVKANVHGLWDVESLVRSISNVQPRTVTITAIGKKVGNWYTADGGMYSPSGMGMWPTFADGGVASFQGQSPQIRRAGGMGVTWAEDGAGPWEAFISGHPAKAARSRAIWLETGRRLGMTEAHADGAVRQYASAPPPQRHYVAPQPRVTVAAPQAAPAQVGASPAQMEAAITRAFAGVKITTNINGRDFAGVMQRTTNDRKGR